MPENTAGDIVSTKFLFINQGNSSEASNKHNLSAKELEEKSSLEKVQVTIRINISCVNDIVSTFPRSKSTSFRLNPILSAISPLSSTATSQNKNFKSEIYYNPKLKKKLGQFEPRLHVDLSFSCLVDADIPIIVNQVIISRKCTDLWLNGNQITSKGASVIASSFTNNSTLKNLDLSSNPISDIGVLSLTQGLLPHQKSSLKFLYLCKTDISNVGVQYLSEMLKTNETLRELWLSYNEISDDGFKQLAYVLAHYNKTLKSLSLSMNKGITDISINYLIEIFKFNNTLKSLWIDSCNLTEHGKMKLREKIGRNNKFKIEL